MPYNKIEPERFRVAARKAVLHLGRLITTAAMILERVSSHPLDNGESTPGTSYTGDRMIFGRISRLTASK